MKMDVDEMETDYIGPIDIDQKIRDDLLETAKVHKRMVKRQIILLTDIQVLMNFGANVTRKQRQIDKNKKAMDECLDKLRAASSKEAFQEVLDAGFVIE